VRFGVRDLHADDYVRLKPAAVAESGGGDDGGGRDGGYGPTYFVPADTPTPTSHTCTATLSLPAYATAEALRAGLDEAFANMEKGGLHEQHH